METEPFYDDPRVWVALAFALFVALAYKKVGGFMARGLDGRSARIKAELDEARRLREEAAAILADYQQKQAHYLKEAEEMLKRAREDAASIGKNAQAELKTALDARMKQASDKIAQEEEKAIADVRNHIVDIALAAARAIIIEQVSHLPQDELIKLAVTDIERKIH